MAAGASQSRLLDVFRRLGVRWKDSATDVRPARIVGRNEDGSARQVRLDGECVGRGGQGGYQGEVVTDLPSLVDRRGTTGAALRTAAGAARSLWVERIEPALLSRGATLTVSIFGGGFSESTVFEFLRPESDDVNADVSIESQTFVSAQQVDVVVTVAADAEIFLDLIGAIAFDDPEVSA